MSESDKSVVRTRAPSEIRQRLNPKLVSDQVKKLHGDLKRMVVGQKEAINSVVEAYQIYLAGMNPPRRPVHVFLFLGPTGVGKTHTVEATAASLLGSESAVIKINCGEFQHNHEIAKLVGSPPGYLGHRETKAILAQRELDKYSTKDCDISIVLFDEIEKADDTLWNLTLGILDKAELTLGDNSRTDFSHSMIFFTSNLGSKEMQDLINPALGFQGGSERIISLKSLTRAGTTAAFKKFTPEFINRLDTIVTFTVLTTEELNKVLELELLKVQNQALAKVSFKLTVSAQVKDYLLKVGVDKRFGARNLKRKIYRLITHPLAGLISTKQITAGDHIEVGIDAKEIIFFDKIDEDLEIDQIFIESGLLIPGSDQQKPSNTAAAASMPLSMASFADGLWRLMVPKRAYRAGVKDIK